MSDYVTINRANWDERAAGHAASAMYGFDRFRDDPAHLSGVVRFDLPLLGDITGQRAVHLQCHIGTDTVSLARLGARVSGLDFSSASLVEARRLAEMAGADVDFREADVYNAVEAFEGETFDLVYTGIGALCWLPDVVRWARVVAGLLRPGGRLFLRDGHPMLRTLDDDMQLHYPYFVTAEPVAEEWDGTYTGEEVTLENQLTHHWNHGMGEIVEALLGAGLRLTGLVEHDSTPWEALPGRMVEGADGEWRLADRPERLAASFTLTAVKEEPHG